MVGDQLGLCRGLPRLLTFTNVTIKLRGGRPIGLCRGLPHLLTFTNVTIKLRGGRPIRSL